ncbi:hypothetical protein CONPUDRAFT_35450, partial [Coniophora puteana RWD-64-598 SS2]
VGVRAGVVIAWTLTVLGCAWVTTTRVKVEDAFLRKNFGDEWDRYAERVRYRLVPGV